jgi:hypothetical protein
MRVASLASATTTRTYEFDGLKSSGYVTNDYSVVAICVIVISFGFALWNKSVVHWYLIPVMACGVLSGVDIVRWCRGRLDLFDPKTLVGCLAFYGFFIAPLLNVAWDTYGVGDLILWGDWRPWLGAISALNAVGLVAYRLASNWAFAKSHISNVRWELDSKKFYPIFALALCISCVGATVFIWQLNGISGVIEAYENNQEAFLGKGWLLLFAWPLVVLSFIIIVYAWTNREKVGRRYLIGGMAFLSVAGIAHFLLLGWYGSRGTTIWALFWMAGTIHYRFRQLPQKMMALGIIFLIAFMYFYGFYKENKTASLQVLRSPSLWFEPAGYQRDFKFLLLGDLARADSNASILHNLVKDAGDYDYRWGLTYAAAFTILIPRNFWPDRPEVRVDAGSEALWGKGNSLRSSRLYGLGGEALLNFGPWGIAPMFALFGLIMGWYRRKLTSWNKLDARMFLAPFFTSIVVRALVYDSDNLVFSTVVEGTLVVVAIFAASRHFEARPTFENIDNS